MSPYLNRVNRIKVSGELLSEVVMMHADMPPEDRPVYEARMFRLFELLDEKGLNKKRAELATAIDFRLTALAKLHDDFVLRAWTMPGEKEGMDYVHATLLEAVAEEPLVEDGEGQVSFDTESFRRRVLANSEVKGSA